MFDRVLYPIEYGSVFICVSNRLGGSELRGCGENIGFVSLGGKMQEMVMCGWQFLVLKENCVWIVCLFPENFLCNQHKSKDSRSFESYSYSKGRLQ